MKPTLRIKTENFNQLGFVYFPSLLPKSLINRFLKFYKTEVLFSQDYFFRHSSRFEVNKLNRHGFVKNSYMDPHTYDLGFSKLSLQHQFAKQTRDLLCHKNIIQALEAITGENDPVLVQSLLFDLNSNAPPHQDTFYTESMPPGHLTGCWIALEDIHREAGKFFLLPLTKMKKLKLSKLEKSSHEEYTQKMRHYIKTLRREIAVPQMKKGDVLFWQSTVVHGSLPTKNSRYSRKSLAGHFLPTGYQLGHAWGTLPVSFTTRTHGKTAFRSRDFGALIMQKCLHAFHAQ